MILKLLIIGYGIHSDCAVLYLRNQSESIEYIFFYWMFLWGDVGECILYVGCETNDVFFSIGFLMNLVLSLLPCTTRVKPYISCVLQSFMFVAFILCYVVLRAWNVHTNHNQSAYITSHHIMHNWCCIY